MSEPSNFYLRLLAQQAAKAESEASGTEASEPADPALQEALAALTPELVDVLHAIHTHAEVAFEEVESAATLVAALNTHGVGAETGVFGLETAFTATLEPPDFDPERHRTIGILAEYDALVGLGHGCGHNVIATCALGAFLALAERREALPGRVVLIGTPAEEGRTGKEIMARNSAFDNLDAAIMLHPYGWDLADQAWLGRRSLVATFAGRSAHASAQPFMGRNALDAATLAYQGLGLLRQQMLSIDRLHAVITDGGKRASIIPDESRLDLYVRSRFPETLLDLSARVDDVMNGAALMTGTTVTLTWDEDPLSLPVRSNGPLTGRWVAAQQARGRRPLPLGSVSDTLAASTDFGNVSYLVPGIHPLLRIADPGTALHTPEFREAAASPEAEAAAVDGAYGLARVALDYLEDDALAAQVRAEFDAAGGRVDVPTFLRGDPRPTTTA